MKKFSIEFSERGHIAVGETTWRVYVDDQFLGHHATLEDATRIVRRIGEMKQNE